MQNFIQTISSQELLRNSAADVEKIRTAVGLPRAAFDAFCLPMLRAYADQVQNAPLTREAFYDAGGAWDMGLKTCFVAAQYAATNMFFPHKDSEERRVLEPQCKYASFVAGLATGVAILAQHASIKSPTAEYHLLNSGINLRDWLLKNQDVTFGWRSPLIESSDTERAAIAAMFIPKGIFENFDLRIPPMIYAAINPKMPMNGVESTLAKVVRSAATVVIEKFIADDQKRYRGSADPSNADPLPIARPAEIDHSNPQPSVASGSSQVPNQAVTSNTAQDGQDVSLEYLMSKAPAMLQEWFEALIHSPNYDAIAPNLVDTGEAIEIPIINLGAFGVSGPAIQKQLVAAGMVVGKSKNGRALLLHRSLRSKLIKEQA